MVRQYMVKHIGDDILLVERYDSLASPDRMLDTLLGSNRIRFGQEDILNPCFDEDELRQRSLVTLSERSACHSTSLWNRCVMGSEN